MIILDITNKRNVFFNLSFSFHFQTKKFYYLDNIVRHALGDVRSKLKSIAGPSIWNLKAQKHLSRKFETAFTLQ